MGFSADQVAVSLPWLLTRQLLKHAPISPWLRRRTSLDWNWPRMPGRTGLDQGIGNAHYSTNAPLHKRMPTGPSHDSSTKGGQGQAQAAARLPVGISGITFNIGGASFGFPATASSIAITRCRWTWTYRMGHAFDNSGVGSDQGMTLIDWRNSCGVASTASPGSLHYLSRKLGAGYLAGPGFYSATLELAVRYLSTISLTATSLTFSDHSR